MPPKVSVLMTVYNGEHYLRESIESILGQTFGDFEFLIIDDASRDDSCAIIESYHDKRVCLIRNETNLGQTRSLNKGLALARGEYLARMDQDDSSLPERLERQVASLETRPWISLVGSMAQAIDERGSIIARQSSALPFPTEPSYVSWRLLWHNCITHSSVVIRRKVIESVGGYDEHFAYAMDYALWSHLSFETDLAQLPEILIRYREHPDSQSSLLNLQRQLAERQLIGQMGFARLLGKPVSEEMACVALGGWRGGSPRSLAELEALGHFIPNVYQAFVKARKQYDSSGMDKVQSDLVRAMCLLQFYERDLSARASRRWLLVALRLLPIHCLQSRQYVRRFFSGSVVESAYKLWLQVREQAGSTTAVQIVQDKMRDHR